MTDRLLLLGSILVVLIIAGLAGYGIAQSLQDLISALRP
jgi:hypothetical protein